MELLGQRRAVAVASLAIVAGAGATLLQLVRTAEAAKTGPVYRSVAELADVLGCTRTLRTVPPVAPVVDAGDCTMSDGARIQLRVFSSMDQAVGWGGGVRETDAGPVDPMAFGDSWVVRILDADRDRANRIFARLG